MKSDHKYLHTLVLEISKMYFRYCLGSLHVCRFRYKRSCITRMSIIANYNRSIVENLIAERGSEQIHQFDDCSLSVDEIAWNTFENIFMSVYKRRIKAERGPIRKWVYRQIGAPWSNVIRITEIRERPKIKGSKRSSSVENTKRSLFLSLFLDTLLSLCT